MKRRAWRNYGEALGGLSRGRPARYVVSWLCLPHLAIHPTSSTQLPTTTTSSTRFPTRTHYRCSSQANQRWASYINTPRQRSTPTDVYQYRHLTPPLLTCNMPPRQPRPHSNTPPPRLCPVHPTLPSFDHSAGTCPNGAPPQPCSTHRTGIQLNHACTSSTNSKSTLNTMYTHARSLFLVS